MTSNQRSAKRYAVNLEIEIAIGESLHRSMTRNLSLGGVFIDTDLRPAFNARVKLRFSIPNQKEPVEVGGVVRWVDPGGFGVQFDGLRARDVWALGKYFEQQ